MGFASKGLDDDYQIMRFADAGFCYYEKIGSREHYLLVGYQGCIWNVFLVIKLVDLVKIIVS